MERIVRACVLYGVGLNCDYETEHTLRLAGAQAERRLVGELYESPDDIGRYDMLVVPGGFSYGDDISAGRVLATKLRKYLEEQITKFDDDGKPIIGICNGCQVLTKNLIDFGGKVTFTYNSRGRFEDRWVYLEPEDSMFTEGMGRIELPVRHGEGRFECDDDTLGGLEAHGQVVFRYTGPDGERDPPYPLNPNGSKFAIAAIQNKRGNVLAMMPHPEGFFSRLQHPRWTREDLPEEGAGVKIFRNAVDYVKKNL